MQCNCINKHIYEYIYARVSVCSVCSVYIAWQVDDAYHKYGMVNNMLLSTSPHLVTHLGVFAVVEFVKCINIDWLLCSV